MVYDLPGSHFGPGSCFLPGSHFGPGSCFLAGSHFGPGGVVTDTNIREAMAADIPAIRDMLREYVAWIGLDLAFQEIDAELDGLPGDYAPPFGALMVALDGPEYVGMIALRPLPDTPSPAEAPRVKAAEMKRLYVRPSARGRGLARQLVTVICDEARRLGYQELRLDTLPMMDGAQALYESAGFVDIDPYYDTPIAGTRFMARRLF
jgi:ribosomal protein S18 acetylase RimI-like enzyme